MKKCINLFKMGFFLSAGLLFFVGAGMAAESALPQELASMVDSLESCRKESMNSEWKKARLTAMNIRKEYTKAIPELVSKGDKVNVNNFGRFLAKLMASIQDQDKSSSLRNLKIIEEITKSFIAHY
jgi:hypothetical protein